MSPFGTSIAPAARAEGKRDAPSLQMCARDGFSHPRRLIHAERSKRPASRVTYALKTERAFGCSILYPVAADAAVRLSSTDPLGDFPNVIPSSVLFPMLKDPGLS